MKHIFRDSVLKMLGILARKRLKKLLPKIIGISGSVGKTSTKEAIAHVLGKKYRVLKSDSSYNTDFGVYLTILEEKSGLSSLGSWIKVLGRSIKKSFGKVTPIDFLILEMGTDQPGDMKVLLDIVIPDVAVMTRISENHLSEGQFSSLEEMFAEDALLQESVAKKEGARVFMNKDDSYQNAFISSYKEKADLVTYSMHEEVGGEENVLSTKDGLGFSVTMGDMHMDVVCPIVGSWHVEVLLPAIKVALSEGMTPEEVVVALKDFRLPAGRMNIIPGKGGVTIIDSSYNASPLAVIKAVELLGKYSTRRVFVFGNMNELGDKSDVLHEEVGAHFFGNVDLLLTVGYGPTMASKIAIAQGLDEHCVKNFDDPMAAASYYNEVKKEGDMVLVKGSQNRVRLERFIKEIMLHPEDASRLLVRQSLEWNKKK